LVVLGRAKMKSLFRLLVCAGLFGLFSGANAQVVDITPDQLDSYVKRHQLVILQLTSPDKKCGYCIGTAETFDSAEKLLKDGQFKGRSDFVFVRIQWSPWRAFPTNMPPWVTLYGVPEHQVIIDGKKVQPPVGVSMGKQESAIQLAEKIAAQALPLLP
jgi:hypothetical protein